MLINRICIVFCFLFSLNRGIKSIKWIEEEVFYKTNLLNIKDSIEIGDNEKAKEIILTFDEKIQEVTNYNKKLLNNSLINALLNKLYEECNFNNILFDSDCYIPSNICITDLELVNIFNNLSSNAFEACIKQDNTE